MKTGADTNASNSGAHGRSKVRFCWLVLYSVAAAGCQSIRPADKEAHYYPQGLQPVPPLRSDAGRSGLGFHAGNDMAFLEGCLIVADDGQFLGLVTRNEFAANSILNQLGEHGSEFSPTSIFNDSGRYGGEFSLLSPFNEFTTTPPQIVTPAGQFVGFLTKNKLKTPGMDPLSLMQSLRRENRVMRPVP